ncbi:hypothetical protein ACWEKT_33950 [Nocardia takedensis]
MERPEPGQSTIHRRRDALDSIAKAVALADLRRRPAEQVKGSKRVWATAITVVNSVGVLPLAYFALGRRR